MLPILQKHHEAHDQGTLITIPFVTVNEYLWLLKAISEVMGGNQGVGREGLFYLACAVSDFFLPSEKMVRPSSSFSPFSTDRSFFPHLLGRAQDPIGRHGRPARPRRTIDTRHGPGPQDPQAARQRMDQRRLRRLLQGPFLSSSATLRSTS